MTFSFLLNKRQWVKCIRLVAVSAAFFLWPSLAVSDQGKIPEMLIQRNEQTLDASLVVTAKSLIHMGQIKIKHLIVDVRSAEDFETLHIPGALNIQPHFIKTRTYLKDYPLVLVDQGLSFHRLAPACIELKKNGFDVRILDGGMNAWSSHGGPMLGDVVRQMSFSRISPVAFFKEKNYTRMVVCDASMVRSTAAERLMPYALHLPLEINSKARFEAIERFITIRARKGTSLILVTDTDENGYRTLMRIFNQFGYKNVFFLDGGIDAYRKYLENLSRSWQPRQDRTVSNTPCRECRDKRGTI